MMNEQSRLKQIDGLRGIGITVINNILGKQFVCLIIIGAVWHDIEKNGFELSSVVTLLLSIAACALTNPLSLVYRYPILLLQAC